MTKRHRGHIIIVEHETLNGVSAIRYDITSDSGQGAAVGCSGWLYEARSLSAAAREAAKVVDNMIERDRAAMAASARAVS